MNPPGSRWSLLDPGQCDVDALQAAAPEAVALMRLCWAFEPQARPTAEALVAALKEIVSQTANKIQARKASPPPPPPVDSPRQLTAAAPAPYICADGKSRGYLEMAERYAVEHDRKNWCGRVYTTMRLDLLVSGSGTYILTESP
jgi:hypothetical protein